MMTVEPAGYDSTGDDDGGDKATTHTPTGLYRQQIVFEQKLENRINSRL